MDTRKIDTVIHNQNSDSEDKDTSDDSDESNDTKKKTPFSQI